MRSREGEGGEISILTFLLRLIHFSTCENEEDGEKGGGNMKVSQEEWKAHRDFFYLRIRDKFPASCLIFLGFFPKYQQNALVACLAQESN